MGSWPGSDPCAHTDITGLTITSGSSITTATPSTAGHTTQSTSLHVQRVIATGGSPIPTPSTSTTAVSPTTGRSSCGPAAPRTTTRQGGYGPASTCAVPYHVVARAGAT